MERYLAKLNALPVDLDGDQDDDLVLVGEWMPPTVLWNKEGKQFATTADRSLAHFSGWWNCVAAGDFDGDGDADLLLGNEGLNTLYRASAREPIQIWGKDFNDDGQFDPIMGYFINGTRYPALPRDALNQQLIQFRRKFRHYRDYAEATFDDLFSEKELRGPTAGRRANSAAATPKTGGKGILGSDPCRHWPNRPLFLVFWWPITTTTAI